MESVFALCVLLCCPLILGCVHFREFESFDNPRVWGRREKVAALIFVFYVGLTIGLGKADIYWLYGDYIGRDSRFFVCFVLPSIGFAIAMFPRAAIELNNDYWGLKKGSTLRDFAYVGWLILAAAFIQFVA